MMDITVYLMQWASWSGMEESSQILDRDGKHTMWIRQGMFANNVLQDLWMQQNVEKQCA